MSKVLLGDVAAERRETCKGSKDGYPTVGLEHLTPEDITLTSWDEGSDNTFTKMFLKGDVLFGRRRAYLKKAAVAPFDGICSGDITVITAKPNYLLPELLPFIIQNDTLFDFAVEKSAGSLSPRVKWEHLKNYEFSLPDMEKQHELSELLWAMDATKKSYQRLVAATDELVKSQFIEMFGDPVENPKGFPIKRISDFTDVLTGATPSRKGEGYYGGDIPWVKTGEIESGLIKSTEESITYKALQETNCKILPIGTVMVAMYGQGKTRGTSGILQIEAATNQACAAILPCDKLNPVFLHQFLVNEYERLRGMGRGAQQANLNLSMIKNYPIVDVPHSLQEQFAYFVLQSDKSKFELEQALSELTATYKRIISQQLG